MSLKKAACRILTQLEDPLISQWLYRSIARPENRTQETFTKLLRRVDVNVDVNVTVNTKELAGPTSECMDTMSTLEKQGASTILSQHLHNAETDIVLGYMQCSDLEGYSRAIMVFLTHIYVGTTEQGMLYEYMIHHKMPYMNIIHFSLFTKPHCYPLTRLESMQLSRVFICCHGKTAVALFISLLLHVPPGAICWNNAVESFRFGLTCSALSDPPASPSVTSLAVKPPVKPSMKPPMATIMEGNEAGLKRRRIKF